MEAVWSQTAEVVEDLDGGDSPADFESTDTDRRDNLASGPAGDNGANENEESDSARDTASGERRSPGGAITGQGPRTGDGRTTTARDRQRQGSASSRTGRQTRLRSYVVETDEDEGAQGTVGDEAPDLSPIDLAGVARVLEHERKCGRQPLERAHSNAGFDVDSLDKRGELVRRIEIKSTGGQWSTAGVMMSRRQHEQAVADADLFWLYVVEHAQDDDYRIYRIQNPAHRIDYYGFDGGWKDVAEPDVERDETGTPTSRATRRFLNSSPGQSTQTE